MNSLKPETKQEYLRRIGLVTEFIHQHLDRELDLATLAGISSFSPYHFHRITRAFLGEPIGSYITRMRLETAATLLRGSDQPVQDIAFAVGYEAPSSLTKAFKMFYQITPSEYRNNINLTIMKWKAQPSEADVRFRKIADMPGKTVIFTTLKGEYGSNNYGDAWAGLWAFVKEKKLFSAGIEHLGISYDDPKVTAGEKCRYDACLVIHKPAVATGNVGVKEVDGGKFAIFLYQGPYNGLGAAYDAIFGKWLPESGMELRDFPCVEKYISNPNNTEPEKLKTEIWLPVR
jgi:AraC family transcriptional regulator